MRFFEEITAIPEQGRLTDSAVYVLAKKEILAAALPGGFPKHAPRFPTAVLAALEGVVSDQSVVLSTSGSTAGGFWSSVGEPCGSLTTGAFDQHTSHSTVKGLSQS